MPLLSDAQKLFVGGTSINKVFTNGVAVWPKGNPDRCVPNLSDFYAAGNISTKWERRNASYYPPYPRVDAIHLLEVFFWAPKCIDDPDIGYCSPVYRFIGEKNDPCIGYEPGENWRGGSQLLYYVRPDANVGGSGKNYPTVQHSGQHPSFSTYIKAERYGSTEQIYRGVPMWWYRLFAFECAPNPQVPCEYSDAIAMCSKKDINDLFTGPKYFQISLYYKGYIYDPTTGKEEKRIIRSNFQAYDANYWGKDSQNRPPDYGYPTNP